jgi:hypothetical protein
VPRRILFILCSLSLSLFSFCARAYGDVCVRVLNRREDNGPGGGGKEEEADLCMRRIRMFLNQIDPEPATTHMDVQLCPIFERDELRTLKMITPSGSANVFSGNTNVFSGNTNVFSGNTNVFSDGPIKDRYVIRVTAKSGWSACATYSFDDRAYCGANLTVSIPEGEWKRRELAHQQGEKRPPEYRPQVYTLNAYACEAAMMRGKVCAETLRRYATADRQDQFFALHQTTVDKHIEHVMRLETPASLVELQSFCTLLDTNVFVWLPNSPNPIRFSCTDYEPATTSKKCVATSSSLTSINVKTEGDSVKKRPHATFYHLACLGSKSERGVRRYSFAAVQRDTRATSSSFLHISPLSYRLLCRETAPTSPGLPPLSVPSELRVTSLVVSRADSPFKEASTAISREDSLTSPTLLPRLETTSSSNMLPQPCFTPLPPLEKLVPPPLSVSLDSVSSRLTSFPLVPQTSIASKPTSTSSKPSPALPDANVKTEPNNTLDKRTPHADSKQAVRVPGFFLFFAHTHTHTKLLMSFCTPSHKLLRHLLSHTCERQTTSLMSHNTSALVCISYVVR